MSGRLIQNAYGPKSNEAVTAEAVLKEAREAADKETMAMGTTRAPAFTLQLEA
jgi:citrate lyase beta subunit